MEGIKNTINLISQNWSTIVAFIGLCFLGYVEVKRYLKMTDEEKVQAALKAIKPVLLKYMSEAEIKWDNYKNSGELKKSTVIQKIYEQFPLLKTYKNQEELIKMLEEMIDDQLKEMNNIINKIPVKDEEKK